MLRTGGRALIVENDPKGVFATLRDWASQPGYILLQEEKLLQLEEELGWRFLVEREPMRMYMAVDDHNSDPGLSVLAPLFGLAFASQVLALGEKQLPLDLLCWRLTKTV